ncbi:hypothetical protein [Bradyrhizobium sp. SZCCHNPS1003]|uniref:hypothetical protein n=1 Tax=Bradyrhizobium sp. SZCCHNPS1003 TaxID=3057330 RepID=UPI0028F0DF63|nr:hypothetical protein [Bradyrhizobium sp. SZCCHNPS1003]
MGVARVPCRNPKAIGVTVAMDDFGKPMLQEAISRMIRLVGGTPAAAVDVQAKKAAAA